MEVQNGKQYDMESRDCLNSLDFRETWGGREKLETERHMGEDRNDPRRSERKQHFVESLFQRHFEKGANIRFWTDIWASSSALSERYPRITALDVNRNFTID